MLTQSFFGNCCEELALFGWGTSYLTTIPQGSSHVSQPQRAVFFLNSWFTTRNDHIYSTFISTAHPRGERRSYHAGGQDYHLGHAVPSSHQTRDKLLSASACSPARPQNNLGGECLRKPQGGRRERIVKGKGKEGGKEGQPARPTTCLGITPFESRLPR